MTNNSDIFDRFRVKPKADRRKSVEIKRRCDKPGCACAGEHKAPKGRGHDGEFWFFCIDHVREYNATYNYFSGMGDSDVASFQKDALTGHRPTWSMGVKSGREGQEPRPSANPFHMFGAQPDRGGSTSEPEPERRAIRNVERKAFDTLGLDIGASPAEIKLRFKELAKRHHPDVNGGDRSQEDRLREIIQAYNYLKQAGLC